MGGKNIRITGCPSVFYTLRCPQVEVPVRLASPERRIGISLHTGLRQSIYCANPRDARKAHVATIRYGIDQCGALYLFEQGVMNEFNIADASLPLEERMAAAGEVLERIDPDQQLKPEDLVTHMVSVTSIEEWLARASELDAIAGFRFHGNMVALLQGKPCYYYVYDSRIREFCELYSLPFQDVGEPWVAPAEAILAHDWDQTNTALRKCDAEMRAFFQENGYQSRVSIPA